MTQSPIRIAIRKLFPVVFCLIFSGMLQAQPIGLRAGKMRGEKRNGVMVQHLEGNVVFDSDGNTVLCDIADYDPSSEELVGSGNVRILSNEGVVVTGSNLVFNNASKQARVSGGVKLTDKGMVLTTPWINYHTVSKIGYYGSGGRIVDGDQVLTSVTGSYNPNIKMLYFRQNVLLTHPDYTVKTDTLQYSTATGTAYFFSYTEISDSDNVIRCNYGQYNTRTGKSWFTKNAAILSKENTIRADTIFYDRFSGIGEAYGRLWVRDSVQKIIIFGQKGYYDRKKKYTKVSGRPLAKKYGSSDSMLLYSDTMVYWSDSLRARRFLSAFGHVQIWQPEFSGTADSISYVIEDSLFHLYGTPVLWNKESRLNSDTMRIFMRNSKVSTMHMRNNSFVAIEEDLSHYSQISGRDMDNYFSGQGKLRNVHVQGDAHSVYYIREQDTVLTSANVVACENLKILMDSSKVSQVRFYGLPKGHIYPLNELPAADANLSGFIWDEENRPLPGTFREPFEVPGIPTARDQMALPGKRK